MVGDEIGVWEYEVSGIGQEPSVGETTVLVARLGLSSQSFIQWQNPFAVPVEVLVGSGESASASAATLNSLGNEIEILLDAGQCQQTVQPFSILQVTKGWMVL